MPKKPYQGKDITYYALILDSTFNSPHLIELFQEKELQKIIDQNDPDIQGVDGFYNAETVMKLKGLIWKPLDKYLTGKDEIFLSLSGLLHKISIPAIIIDEPYNVTNLSSTRNLIPVFNEMESSDLSSILYGDIDYDHGIGKVDSNRSLDNISELVQRSGYIKLPYTRTEIDSVSNLLSSNNYYCELISDSAATKESFKKISGSSPKILHIATHAFYYPVEQDYRANELLLGRSDHSVVLQNPLYRSGLLFAGANSKIGLKSNDGIMTSFEISKMNLENVDMVVLSACETGLGDIKSGEGVYGLQRAFKMAGVNTIIMSLWKVPDKQTSELMVKFYEYYLQGYTKQKALSLSQMHIKKKYPQPYYWAAFSIIE